MDFSLKNIFIATTMLGLTGSITGCITTGAPPPCSVACQNGQMSAKMILNANDHSAKIGLAKKYYTLLSEKITFNDGESESAKEEMHVFLSTLKQNGTSYESILASPPPPQNTQSAPLCNGTGIARHCDKQPQ